MIPTNMHFFTRFPTLGKRSNRVKPLIGKGLKKGSGPVGRILLRGRPLDPPYGDHPSRPPIAKGLKPPTRALEAEHPFRARRPVVRLLGVAPGGGYRVSHPRCFQRILVSVALFLALGGLSPTCCVRPLAVTLSCGVRTFLSWHASSGRPAHFPPES